MNEGLSARCRRVERQKAGAQGVADAMLRLSIGLADAADPIADLGQALEPGA